MPQKKNIMFVYRCIIRQLSGILINYWIHGNFFVNYNFKKLVVLRFDANYTKRTITISYCNYTH